jgi:hypothetical protein
MDGSEAKNYPISVLIATLTPTAHEMVILGGRA